MLNVINMIKRSYTIYIIFTLMMVSVCPFFGAESLKLQSIISDMLNLKIVSIDTSIFLEQRLPRVLLAFVTGAVLAVTGNAFQIILRNPLATPYTLGVTSGAALGAYFAIAFPVLYFSLGAYSSVQLFSMFGAGVIVAIIYLASIHNSGLSMNVMLLAGVTISIMCSAFIMLLRYLTKPDLIVSLDRWTMGRLDTIGYGSIISIFPFVIFGVTLILANIKMLNLIAMGDEMAVGYGVNVASVQKACFIGGSIATAAIVSVAGPIGFIGMIIPHFVRKVSGFDNIGVMTGCFWVGGSFLVLCDTVSRTIVAPTEIPVGVITALIGGPSFIYILIKNID